MSNLFEVKKSGTGYTWTEEQKKYIFEQYSNGSTASSIAQKFHVSSVTITKVLNSVKTPTKIKPKATKDDSKNKPKGKRGRKPVCPFCKNPIKASEESVPYKTRAAHKKCFEGSFTEISDSQKTEKEERQAVKKEKIIEKQKEKAAEKFTKTQLKEGMSEEEFAKKKKLLDYIESLGTPVTSKVLVLCDRYIKNYNFTWESMYQTLVYLHDIKQKILTDDIVGIIPYYHSEAMGFTTSVEQIKEANGNIDMRDMYKIKVIKIKPPVRKVREIDIESVGTGEEWE